MNPSFAHRTPLITTKDPPTPFKKKPVMRLVLDSRQRAMNSRGEGKRLSPLMESLLKTYDAKDLDKVKELLSSGLSVNYKEPARANRTPLVYAAKTDFVEAVNELLERGADPQLPDDMGMTPLHAAAGNGSLEPLKRLLEEKEVNPNAKDIYGKTPLHFATQALGEDEEDNALNIVHALLKAGAVVSIKDVEDRTPVHAAAWAGNTEVLSLLLSERRSSLVSEKDKYGRTPLHQAALGARSLLAVKILLHYNSPVDGKDNQGRTALHYVAERPINYVNKEFDGECLELLLACGASVHVKDNDGYNALSLALQRTMWWSKSPRDAILHCVQLLVAKGSSIVDGFDMWRIVETFPSLVLVALNQSIRSNTSAKDSPHLKLTFDFRPLTVSTRLLDERKRKNTLTPIAPSDELPIPPPLLCDSEISMLHYIFWVGHKNILRHPLCSAFLHLKWLKVRKFFIINVTLYFLFVIALTAFILSRQEVNTSDMNNNPYINVNNTNVSSHSSVDNRTDAEMKVWLWWIIIIFAISFTTKEILQIGHSPFIYFRHFENYMDIFILVSVIVLLHGGNVKVLEWERQISIIAVIVSWGRLMLFLGQFPSCGVYIVMFSTVCKTVVRFLSLYLPLLIAFSLGFLILFQEMGSFQSIMASFVHTMVMMTGEIDLEGKFIINKNPSSKFFSCLILIIFLLLMYIILSNLLVALAVNDMNAIQQRSELLRLSRQVELMVTVDRFLKSPCIPEVVRTFLQKMLSITQPHSQTIIAILPNRKLGFTEKLYLKILFVFRCRRVLTKIFEQFVVNFIPPESGPSLPRSLIQETTQLALTELEIEKRDRLLYSKSHQIGSLRQRALQRKERQMNPDALLVSLLPRRESLQEKLRAFPTKAEEHEIDPTSMTSSQQVGRMQPTPSLKASLWRASVRREAYRNLSSNIANSERQTLNNEIVELRKQITKLQSCIDTLISKLLPQNHEQQDFKRTSFPIFKHKNSPSLIHSLSQIKRSTQNTTDEDSVKSSATSAASHITVKPPHETSSDEENIPQV